jgi:hypothetical protein
VTKRIDDPPQAPTMLVADLRDHDRPRRSRLADNRVRVIDHKEGPARRAADRVRAEPPRARVGRYHPEDRVANRELNDDLISIPDAMKHLRVERGRIERDCGARTVNPQLRLNLHHPLNRKPADAGLSPLRVSDVPRE